ncbi:MAG: radical SAM/SPASM domain-containing protein [Promethearchaeota archaeon]
MIEFPKYIQLETSILCNAECYFCPQNLLLRKPKFMSEAVWKKIIDDSRDRSVTYRPFLVNEPLTDRRLPEIIKYIKMDPTARVELNSNAIGLSKNWSKNLFDAGLDLIKFSIDAFSPESYEASGRGSGSRYNSVVKNILNFLEIKYELNHPCTVYVRMIDMPFNRHEHKAFVDFWSEKADCAQIVPLYSWPWTGQKSPYLKPCPKIRDEMFFYVDGRATLCCWDNWERGCIGDIMYSSIENIWLGQINTLYRKLLDQGKRDKILLCSRCDAYRNYDFSKWNGY